MALPGLLSGMLWCTGNFLSIYGVLLLGQATAYPSVQAGLIVSGLWGIFYYKELKKWQILIWFASAFIALGGIVLLSQMKA
jgi:glucose uptake protein GlcU